MELEKVSAKIRPRRGWEAIDLGVSLVQKHFVVLYKIWFGISLPTYLLISIMFWQPTFWIVITFWWLLPILERPLLHFLSRELFGESLSVKQCIKNFNKLAKIQWFASLSWRRLSFTRSFDLALIQLEGLNGRARTNRIRVIHSGDSGSAMWLTVIFFLISIILFVSILMFIYLIVPEVYLENFNFWNWITLSGDTEGVIYLYNFLAYICLSAIAPFYIACGFTLYLNQRTHLEAWDIELAFKRLALRLSEYPSNMKTRLASWLGVGMLILTASIIDLPDVKAESEIELSSSTEDLLKEKIETSIDKNLSDKLSQKLSASNEILELSEITHESAKRLIDEIKSGESFHQMKTVETSRYRNSGNDNSLEIEPSSGISPGWLMFANLFAMVVEFALWIFVFVLIVFLVLKYKHLLVGRIGQKQKHHKRPKKLFGLDLDSEKLPDDPWAISKNLIEQKKYREALSLLYRASLIWYVDNSQAVIKEGYTELECFRQIASQVSIGSREYFLLLTNAWRQLAYAHKMPEKDLLIQLCDNWPKIMRPVVTQNDTEKQVMIEE